ncbi:interferon-inducible double-stranded RNA-dependent protein kinase activator A homolog isoform X3 [Penaeus japonicus]|uniref:TAR RNA-binding protein isoform 3 n=1 Tax=Penaeus japonicus TaxID=27405 RepID=F4YXI2_PENJP|nr:interferon-inducible double-stranded RNA-dependent protein kinase activator A homolog isoform X3 [Penaeus japonicus]AEE36483.1 TAR RNA-binding protein isoform 3 [Penaeus japonicus]
MYHQPPPNVDSSSNVEGMSGALPSKTPVSLLQELCMRRGISPKYDLLQIEGAVHEPTFVYRVTVGEFAANGSGQSKKKAKHAAAKAVLDIIIQGGAAGAGGPTSGGAPGAPPELSTQIVSPYDDGIPGNPVGSLQELCMARRWPPPTYELTSEEGFPHERTFSIACTIGNTREIGTGKSKKLAKRQAAYKMTQLLKDQPVEAPQVNVLADDDDETISLSNVNLNFVQMLQDIAQEANFVVTYVDIEELSVSGQHQCLVQLSTLPVAVCYGTGANVKEAQSAAAHNALEYLKIMTNK